jgi:Fe-S-cluster containining protein
VRLDAAAARVKILNIAEGTGDRPGFSTNPCARCDARCCAMRPVISAVEAALVARHLSRPLMDVVRLVRWYPSAGTLLAWPFKLDVDGETARHTFTFRQRDGRCALLDTALFDGRGGCGVYEARPSNCRLFPFDLEDERGRVRVGHTAHCPTQWLQDDDTRAGAARDLARYREMRAVDLAAMRLWNKGKRERSVERFSTWLTETVAPQLG